jgi:hypothetical protein
MNWDKLAEVYANLGWVWEGDWATRLPKSPALPESAIETSNPLNDKGHPFDSAPGRSGQATAREALEIARQVQARDVRKPLFVSERHHGIDFGR